MQRRPSLQVRKRPATRSHQPLPMKGRNVMDLRGKLRKGLHIFGTDNREYGTVDRYDDQYAYVGERKIPVSAFERMDKDRLYISDQGRQYFETGDRMADSGEVRVRFGKSGSTSRSAR